MADRNFETAYAWQRNTDLQITLQIYFLLLFFFLNQLNIAIHTHKTYICMHMYTTVFLVSYNFLKNGLNFKAVVVVLFFP